MAQQCEDEGPATDISRQGRQGERPDKVAPGQISIKHQIKDLDRAHETKANLVCRLLLEKKNRQHFATGIFETVSYTTLRAHATVLDLVCLLLLETKQKQQGTS